MEYLTIILLRLSEYCEPEENNCFSITQVIIRATAFPFIFFVSSSETSRNRAAATLKISTSVL